MGRSANSRDLAVLVEDANTLQDVFRLRAQAWKARRPAFPDVEDWCDRFDSAALNWAVFEGGRLIAAARLTLHDRLEDAPDAEIYLHVLGGDPCLPVAVLGRLVAAPGQGGRGLSQVLDRVRIDHARRRGSRSVVGAVGEGSRRLEQMLASGFRRMGTATAYSSGPLARIPGAPVVVRMLL